MNKVINFFANSKDSFNLQNINVDIPKVAASDTQISNLFDVAYFWAGIVCVIIIIISGILYITSTGDKGKVATAKMSLTYAVIGLVIIILAFAITKFVLGAL